MYKAVLFDLDGTLLNTLDDLHDSTNRALAAFDFPLRTLEEVRNFVGNGIRCLIERAVPPGTPEEVCEKVLEAFRQDYAVHSADQTAPYRGIPSLLSSLREDGKKTAVVSNKADFAVQTLCARFFPGLTDFSIGEKEAEGIRKKPAPDMLKKALRHFSLTKEDAVYVGDSDVDFETAENAGMDLILVNWGFRDDTMLRALASRTSPGRKTTVVSTPEELFRHLTDKG